MVKNIPYLPKKDRRTERLTVRASDATMERLKALQKKLSTKDDKKSFGDLVEAGLKALEDVVKSA